MAGNKNSGRKSRAEEIMTARIAGEAITKKYGSMLEGMVAALNSEEPALVKFVYEHAYGKPTDNINLGSDGTMLPIQIIQLPDNGRNHTTTEQEQK